MPIEKFTVADFDNALPKGKNGERLFTHIGISYDEHCWVHKRQIVPIRLCVRSSIGYSGVSAGLGQNSIRLWIEQEVAPDTWKGVGKSCDAYTTREKGWEDRLKEKIKILSARIYSIKFKIPEGGRVAFKKADGRPIVFVEGKFHSYLDTGTTK